ncbi:MAG: hypothetical protein Q7W55_07565 [Pseudohongiella sp.]|nr:hypothetical protein [Pseudohongiella sp.]
MSGIYWQFDHLLAWDLLLSLYGYAPIDELNTATAWLIYRADTILVSAAMLFHWMPNIAFSHIIKPM